MRRCPKCELTKKEALEKLKQRIQQLLDSINKTINDEQLHRKENYPHFQHASELAETFEKGRKAALHWVLTLLEVES